jgi:hypothetical protein
MPSNQAGATRASTRTPWLRAGLAVALLFVCLGFLPACSGGGGGGGGDTQGSSSGGQFEDPNAVPDDRYVDGDGNPDGTGSSGNGGTTIPPLPTVEDTSLY